MNETAVVTLPGGYWLDGICHRQAEVRSLTGDDEAFLFENGESLLPAERATALLTRCLSRLGTQTNPAADVVRSLTVGDREALLLHVRRLTLGERLHCVIICAQCGEKMDLEMKVGDLLAPPYSLNRERPEVEVTDNGVRYRVRLRLLTGGDAEAAAAMALVDPRGAADLLLYRCVESITTDNGRPVDELPAALLEYLPAALLDLDPQAEIRMKFACLECKRPFCALFDASAYFFQEIAAGIKQLYREVHTLAFYYHWSEAEIIRMTRRKRQRYLRLLAEALAQ